MSPVAAAAYTLGFKAGLTRTLATTPQLNTAPVPEPTPTEIFRRDYAPYVTVAAFCLYLAASLCQQPACQPASQPACLPLSIPNHLYLCIPTKQQRDTEYRPPFSVPHINIDFNLGETTMVTSVFSLQRQRPGDLILDAPEDSAAMSLKVQ